MFSLFFIVSFVFCGQFYNFNAHKVQFVDANMTIRNYLFRGSYVGKTNSSGKFFDTTPLRATILKISQEQNLSIPEDFYLVDVSLIFKYWNVEEYKLEEEYWNEHQEEGKLIYWPIVGGVVNASTIPKDLRDTMIRNYLKWDYDHLHSRIPDIYEMLNSPQKRPTVFYGHCSAGSDRTGEFFGAYYMEVLGWDFPKAMKQDATAKGHEIERRFAYLLNWYCYFLEMVMGRKDLRCDDWNY